MAKEGKEGATVDCLMNAISDTQETIRGYDTKAEILGIMMTLVVGLLNFNMLSDYKRDCAVMVLIATATVAAMTALTFMLAVLFPSRNPIEEVDLGDYKPKNAYFIFKSRKDKYDLNSIYSKLTDIDWSKELLLELLKVSSIRDRKHRWFTWAVKVAAFTFFAVALLIVRVGYICSTK